MSALTVTLGADISALKRGMAAASQLVAASARRMSAVSAAGLAGIAKGGAAVLESGFAAAGTAMKASIASALAGGAAAAGAGIKAVTAAAGFEQTKAAFTTMIGDAAKAEATLARLRELGAQTPFEFPELADAGRKLIAFGESAAAAARPIWNHNCAAWTTTLKQGAMPGCKLPRGAKTVPFRVDRAGHPVTMPV
jgi:hypothetical protein